ncbi:sulfatase-like hydrolase/transferase [Halorussus caseinilyticus]|uniref:Sulfatase-like hydrolase/transferase n=1 Tax=Halorussus caseinilyticus TaxID=3034025 RepID=A0ABD5WPV6_9EURY|nr:sulfatase-like hydrolase/transferase [Halorussus sp. DT72]
MSGPNVAVVVLDTLRADAFEDEFDWLSGVRFADAYSTSHWTVPAHASLFTGRYASEVGVHAKSPALDCEDRTLAEAFRSAGYTTRLWTANPQLFEWDEWDRGFDQYVGPYELPPTADGAFDWQSYVQSSDRDGVGFYLDGLRRCLRSEHPTLRSLRHGYREFRRSVADGGTRALHDRLRATDFGDRELLVVNLMEAHSPWEPPEPYRTVAETMDVTIGEAFAGEVSDPDRIRRAYRDSVRYLADAYADLFADLRERFDYVVTLSDHGELLGERGLWNHGYGLAPELTRVPLVVSGEGLPDETRDDPASLLDVHRTVAALAGVEVESRGRDLLSDDAARDRLVEFHGFLPWHRDQFRREGVEDVFDARDSPLDGIVTAGGGYAHETHDAADETRATGPNDGAVRVARGDPDRPTARLASLRESVARREVSDAPTEVSDDVRDRLEELGYA